MKISIFAKTFPGKAIEEVFKKIEEHGIKGVHYNMSCSGLPSLPRSAVPEEKKREFVQALGKYDLKMVGISATFNMIHPDPYEQEKGLQSLEILAQFSAKVHIPFISLCTGTRDPQDKWKWHPANRSAEAWKDLLTMTEKAIEIAETYGVLLGIEPEQGNIVQNAVKAKKLLAQIQSKKLGIIIDPANLLPISEPTRDADTVLKEAFDILHDHIVMAHAKDIDRKGTETALGQGIVNFPLFLQLLNRFPDNLPLVLHGMKAHEVPLSLTYVKNFI